MGHTWVMTTRHLSEVVRLADLATASPVITNQVFENCLIVGPAVIAPIDGGFTLQGCDLGGSEDALLWDVSDRPHLIGAIGLVDCHFIGCRFENVGLAGSTAFLDRIRVDVMGIQT